MARKSVDFVTPNDDWVKSKIESQEYRNTSELINDLIRRERERESVRDRLIEGEQSGFTDKTPDQILADIREKARDLGKL